jgi:hypothetical protein
MHRAWLECLVAVIRRNLFIPFLFMLVVVVTMTAAIVIFPFVVVTMICVALPVVETITPMMLFRDTANLLIVLFPELITHLAHHTILHLMLAFLCNKSHLPLAS